jgi:hypothetical protein
MLSALALSKLGHEIRASQTIVTTGDADEVPIVVKKRKMLYAGKYQAVLNAH